MDINIVVLLLIGLNIIVSYNGFNDTSFFRKYEYHIGSIRAGEQYRMVTSAFLHADFTHLLFNMVTLYFFAPTVVFFMGTLSFILVYAASLVCGSLLTLYFHKNEYHYRAIGASGAVMGVVYASILLQPMAEIYFMPAYIFGIIYMLFSIYGMKAKRDNIGHTAHFGGAIGGYVITLTQMPGLFQNDPLVVILLAVPIIVLLILAQMGKI